MASLKQAAPAPLGQWRRTAAIKWQREYVCPEYTGVGEPMGCRLYGTADGSHG